jgi:hypothetical protein
MPTALQAESASIRRRITPSQRPRAYLEFREANIHRRVGRQRAARAARTASDTPAVRRVEDDIASEAFGRSATSPWLTTRRT